MRILLVNPWIADVAAFNFWLRPLGLYRLGEWLWERGATPVLLDCLSPASAPGPFPRTPLATPPSIGRLRRRLSRYGISLEEFRRRLTALSPFDAVLVTSALSYWYPGVLWVIEEIRRFRPDVPVVLGGAYPTLWPKHATERSGADHVFVGALGDGTGDLARLLGLPEEPTHPFRPWHELNLHDGAAYSAVRTARGCPFRCTYCASERLSGAYLRRPVGEVVAELRALITLGVSDIAFYDDALLVGFRDHLEPILEGARDLQLRYHTPNGLHARLVDESVARALTRSNFATVRLSLETVDPERQRASGNKVASGDLNGAVAAFLDAGLPREALGVYLMMGLPGQGLEEVRQSIDFVRSLAVRPYVSEFSPIPGTPEWKHLTDSGIIPNDLDPLLTNNSIFYRLFSGYPEEEAAAMLRDARRAVH